MPCLNVSTNVKLEGVNTSPILSEISKAVANIIGKPEARRRNINMVNLCIASDIHRWRLEILAFAIGGGRKRWASFSPFNHGITSRVHQSLDVGFISAHHMGLGGEKYVMVLLKGSVPISFGGSVENSAFGELTSIGGLNADVNKKLSAAIAAILEEKISVSKSRFFIKFTDTKASSLKLRGDLFWHMLRSHSSSHWSNACLHQH
ncbi:hypothetical protein C5167_021526 [Papaver somniferum]|nr:hypothetical protein C5167_021526 [Papaver somniferum]